MIDDFVKRNQAILFYNVKPSIVAIFEGVKPHDFKVCKSEEELNEMLCDCYVRLKQNGKS